MNRPAPEEAIWRARLRALRRGVGLFLHATRLVAGVSLDRRRGRTDTAERRILRFGHRLARTLDLRVRVDGEVPANPCVLVANHLSYLDIPLLWTLVPGRFVARADVADWPGIGLASRILGTIFLERERKRALLDVLPEMTGALREGHSVFFFPEATSTRGDRILPFKSSLFEVATRSGAPVVAASLHYETPAGNQPAGDSVCWWGDMTFLPHLTTLLTLPSIEARVRFEPVPVPPSEGFAAHLPIEGREGSTSSSLARSRKRKETCRLAYEAVQKKFIPTTPLESSAIGAAPPGRRTGSVS